MMAKKRLKGGRALGLVVEDNSHGHDAGGVLQEVGQERVRAHRRQVSARPMRHRLRKRFDAPGTRAEHTLMIESIHPLIHRSTGKIASIASIAEY